jgi:hypothetical protein
MRPFKRVCLAGALTLVSFQLLAPSAQSQDGTKPGPRDRIVEDTRAAPYIADQRPEIADEARTISDAFLLIVSAVFVHGIIQAASEPGTGI